MTKIASPDHTKCAIIDGVDLFVSGELLSGDERRRGTAQAIYRHLRDAITSGRLAAGDPVPPSRALAAELGVSRHTVTSAYGLLVAEGHLAGAAGGGTRVVGPGPTSARVDARRPTQPWRSGPGAASRTATATSARPAAARPGVASTDVALIADLRLGTPELSLFPVVEWRRRLGRELHDRAGRLTGYRDPLGEQPLRDAIAAWIQRARGVEATPSRVVVTAGAQHAFDLVLGACVQPGEIVAMEDPGYHLFRQLAGARHADVVGVPVDDEGIVVESIPPRARVVHVTPSHQFPLGLVMSARRRRELLAWAGRHRAVIVEDDYDSELRYAGRPLEPLQLLDRAGVVVYVGTFSKTLAPALRVGFAVVPDALAPEIAQQRAVSAIGPDPFVQRALAGWLDDGAMARHVHRSRRVYAPRRALLLQALTDDLAAWGRVPPSAAGLHVAFLTRPDIDADAVAADLAARGVAVDRVGRYAVGSVSRAGLALGWGGATESDLTVALGLVRDALAGGRSSRPTPVRRAPA